MPCSKCNNRSRPTLRNSLQHSTLPHLHQVPPLLMPTLQLMAILLSMHPPNGNLSKSQVAHHSSASNETKKTFSSGRRTGAVSSSAQESTNWTMKKNAISTRMLTSVQPFPCPQRNGLTASKCLTSNLKMLITLLKSSRLRYLKRPTQLKQWSKSCRRNNVLMNPLMISACTSIRNAATASMEFMTGKTTS